MRAEARRKRERLGIQESREPASQVGNRRYARGRAYVPDVFQSRGSRGAAPPPPLPSPNSPRR